MTVANAKLGIDRKSDEVSVAKTTPTAVKLQKFIHSLSV